MALSSSLSPSSSSSSLLLINNILIMRHLCHSFCSQPQQCCLTHTDTQMQRQTDTQTVTLTCWAMSRSAQSTVLLSNITTVIGPTPPGTGVIHDATDFTASKSTSPTNLFPDFFVSSTPAQIHSSSHTSISDNIWLTARDYCQYFVSTEFQQH